MALVPGSLPMCPSPWNGAEAVQSPSRRSDFQLSPTLGGRASPSTAGASNNQRPESLLPSSREVRRAVTSTELPGRAKMAGVLPHFFDYVVLITEDHRGRERRCPAVTVGTVGTVDSPTSTTLA